MDIDILPLTIGYIDIFPIGISDDYSQYVDIPFPMMIFQLTTIVINKPMREILMGIYELTTN